jgi:hypothetical protein
LPFDPIIMIICNTKLGMNVSRAHTHTHVNAYKHTLLKLRKHDP